MPTNRREFIRTASLVTAGLGVAGSAVAEATDSGAKTGLDMLILGGTGFLEQQEVAPWTHLPVWIPAKDEYAAFHLVSTEKAVAAGLKFRPLADTARDTVAWCNDARGPDYEFGAGGAGITGEREAELLRAWHGRLTAMPSTRRPKPPR